VLSENGKELATASSVIHTRKKKKNTNPQNSNAMGLVCLGITSCEVQNNTNAGDPRKIMQLGGGGDVERSIDIDYSAFIQSTGPPAAS
jgi:hypothetical protein